MLSSLLRFTSGVLLLSAVTFAQNTPDETSLLMQLDRDFDKSTTENGVDGWVAYFAPNGSMLSDTSKPIIGADEIRKAMEPAFKDSSFSLRWHPVKAEMLMPGILGYTVGRWERLRKNKEGKLMKSTGSYTSIWKKQPDSSWKIVLDTGNPDGPPVEIK
jgi:ketosteroid isomerase-like protein